MTKPKEITQEQAHRLLEAAWEAVNLINMVGGCLPREVIDGRGGLSLWQIAGNTRDSILDVINEVEG